MILLQLFFKKKKAARVSYNPWGQAAGIPASLIAGQPQASYWNSQNSVKALYFMEFWRYNSHTGMAVSTDRPGHRRSPKRLAVFTLIIVSRSSFMSQTHNTPCCMATFIWNFRKGKPMLIESIQTMGCQKRRVMVRNWKCPRELFGKF